MLGLTPRVRFNSVLAAEARLTAAGASGRRMADGELALVLQPAPALALRAGMFWRKQQLDAQGSNSDVKLTLTGPMVSVGLVF